MTNHSTRTKEEMQEFFCPNGIIRDIEAVYDENPFKDPTKPTKAELDQFNTASILKLREMAGIKVWRNGENATLVMDHCMCAQALWADEKKFTKKWGKDCGKNPAAHCGFNFYPPAKKQKKYLPKKHPTCGKRGIAEGVGGTQANIPWSLRLGRTLCGFIRERWVYNN